jgi:hypothetical protein
VGESIKTFVESSLTYVDRAPRASAKNSGADAAFIFQSAQSLQCDAEKCLRTRRSALGGAPRALQRHQLAFGRRSAVIFLREMRSKSPRARVRQQDRALEIADLRRRRE